MQRTDAIVAAVHQAWCVVSLELGERPIPFDIIEPWRLRALEHTVGFWESWGSYQDLDYPTFLAATQITWIQYHRRNGWTYSELQAWVDLPADQQRKLRAMLDTYILFRSFSP